MRLDWNRLNDNRGNKGILLCVIILDNDILDANGLTCQCKFFSVHIGKYVLLLIEYGIVARSMKDRHIYLLTHLQRYHCSRQAESRIHVTSIRTIRILNLLGIHRQAKTNHI